jgi:hypothetical protein
VTIFKSYTEENCLLECRAKHLLRLCGCLPYYYPRLDIFLHARSSNNNNNENFNDNNDDSFNNNNNNNSSSDDSFYNNNSSSTSGEMLSSTCDLKGLLCLSNASGLIEPFYKRCSLINLYHKWKLLFIEVVERCSRKSD